MVFRWSNIFCERLLWYTWRTVLSEQSWTWCLLQKVVVSSRRYLRWWMLLVTMALSSAWPIPETVIGPRGTPREESCNISAFTDLILTKLFRPNFLRALIFLDQTSFDQNYFGTKIILGPKLFWDQQFFGPKFCWARFFTKHLFGLKFFGPKICLNSIFLPSIHKES